MATITEDYCDFETAKLLKEKGFNERLFTFYTTDETKKEGYFELMAFTDDKINNNHSDYCYLAPTLQMTMKWLREVHKISIEITSTGYLIDNDIEWECDIKAGHRLYFKHITNEKSFESCAEAAILKQDIDYILNI